MVDIQVEDFSSEQQQASLITLQNEDIIVKICDIGATIVSLKVKDNTERWSDVVLGFDTIDEYLHDDKYFGAVVGRCAGRIAKGTFTLHDQEYHLAINNNGNALHGGIEGFHKKRFMYAYQRNQLHLRYISKHLEEGYPGNLTLDLTYTLEANKLTLQYRAECDEDSILNLTNHTYFNLNAHNAGTVLHHSLHIAGSKMACNNDSSCPDGHILNVSGTPFDFTTPYPIGQRIDGNHLQLLRGNGYDHYYFFDRQEDQITLYSPLSGRRLQISTSLPGVQLYTANYLSGAKVGKEGCHYDKQCAVCLETQHMPDAIHLQEHPTVLIQANVPVEGFTTYTFDCI